jgi:hypothetical protein
MLLSFDSIEKVDLRMKIKVERPADKFIQFLTCGLEDENQS